MQRTVRFSTPWPTRPHGWFAIDPSTVVETVTARADAESCSYLTADALVTGSGPADSVSTALAQLIPVLAADVVSLSTGSTLSGDPDASAGSGSSVGAALVPLLVADVVSLSTGSTMSGDPDAATVSVSQMGAVLVPVLAADTVSESFGISDAGSDSASSAVSLSTVGGLVIPLLIADTVSLSTGLSVSGGPDAPTESVSIVGGVVVPLLAADTSSFSFGVADSLPDAPVESVSTVGGGVTEVFAEADTESESDVDEDFLVFQSITTSETVPAVNTLQTVNLDKWVRYVDLAILGGGGGGNTGLGGSGGAGARWTWTTVNLERYYADNGFNIEDENYLTYLEYQYGSGGPTNQTGQRSFVRFVAKNRTTNAVTQLAEFISLGGAASSIPGGGGINPGPGGQTSGGTEGGTGGVRDVRINNILYVGANTSAVPNPANYPGGGGHGTATGSGAKIGKNGQVNLRFFNSAKVSVLPFTTATAAGSWVPQVIPNDTTEVALAVVGGGGSGGGGGAFQAGWGGTGGRWAPNGNGKWVVESLLIQQGLTVDDLDQLIVEYQVGAGGNASQGQLFTGPVRGNDGQQSSARIVAKTVGGARIVMAGVSGLAGSGQAPGLITVGDDHYGKQPTGGNTPSVSGGPLTDFAVTVLGKRIVFRGGKTQGTYGRPGNEPGGGGAGGSLSPIGPGSGGRGSAGAVYVAFG